MLSVVITSHHNPQGAFLTAFAVKAQLDGRVPDYEIILVADGGSEINWENQGIRCLRCNAGSPQGSRDLGIRAAKYDDVLVLEDHVIVSDIVKLLLEHQFRSAALTFCARKAESSELFDVYGCSVNWDGNLWYKRLFYEQPAVYGYSQRVDAAYPVGQFGNSCFVLDRKWYLESGGYTDLMRGWGAEEPFICLKAWMLGRKCWLLPMVWHAHFLTPNAHGNEILGQSNEFKRNFEILGYVIAGRPCPNVTAGMTIERQRICAGPFQGDLDKLRTYLQKEGVVC